MNGPLVSISMPTYRRPKLLRKALASAVGQTYKNLQIIVRDNASGDETPEVVRSFGDPRILYLQAPRNEGGWRNGAECIRRANGKYLLPLCDDDILGENYVATLIEFMERDPEIVAAYGATHSIDKDGAVTGKAPVCGTLKWTAREILHAWTRETLPLMSGINFVCLTSLFRELEAKICFPDGHHSDNAVFLTAGIRGKVLFTDECVFYYRLHSLNSVERWGCQLRAQGDKELLRFLDSEVKSPRNLNLPLESWRKSRVELQKMFCSGYAHHFLTRRLHNDSALEILRNLMVYPVRPYGVRKTLGLLRKLRRPVLTEIWDRIHGSKPSRGVGD